MGNHAYQLQCTNEAQGDAARVQMQFTEQQPKLGELKITGNYVQRVTLEGGPYLVVLDKPEAMVKVPVGRYGPAKVCLKKGDTEAYLDGRTQAAAGRITVSEKAPAVLTAGGPLTNSVSISRQGRKLALNYQLVGAGGAYQMVNQDRSHPPEFTVYQGDKKVGVGQVRVWLRQHLLVLMASTSHDGGQAEGGGLCRPGRAGIEAGRAGRL